MTSRIPPLLEPYLRLPPEASLLVLTGVVGASTNWLVHRFLCSFLGSSPSSDRHAAPDAAYPDTAYPDDAVSVVLVSFLRDYAFWKEGAGKTGVDLDLLARKGRFVYVDGLGRLFSDPKAPAAQPATSGSPGSRVLANATLAELRKQVLEAVTSLQHQGLGSKVVLVLDSPDLMLAASGEAMPVVALQDVLLDVREKVHSSVVTLAADEPLVSAQTTTLEKEHAALAVSMAHEADMVMSLRMLDTGTAKDVSGVLRVTRGGAAAAAAVEERELLYFVGGDGSIRVFERGQ